MASREEEKRRRREERLAAEREAAQREARTRRLRLGGGIALLALVVIGVVLAVTLGSDSNGGGPSPANAKDLPKLPAVKETDLQAATRAARCRLGNYPNGYEQRGHVSESTKVTYATNPPSFGRHFDSPASDGDYVGQGSPAAGNVVHALEHGRIEYQYRPGLPAPKVRQLEALFEEKPDYVLLFENNTKMKGDVAAVAWTHVLRCDSFNPRVFDAMRAFRDAYTLKAPEVVAQPE